MRPHDLTIDASPAANELAARYAVLLAGTACVAVWWHNQADPGAVWSDQAWLVVALHRLIGRLPGPPPVSESLAAAATEALAREVLTREETRRSFDLAGDPVPG